MILDVGSDEDEEETIPGATLRHARILVADDDEALRFLIVSRLLDDGHEVVEVETGPRVLARLDATFDLLVIDQRMPGLVGLDVVRTLREQGQRIPTILMTAFPEPSLQIEAEHLHVPILAKPFSLLKLSRLAQRSIHDRKPSIR